MDLLVDLIGADITPEQGRLLNHIGVMLFWRIAFIIFVVFAIGGLSFLGLAGFVRADELDRRISAQVQPLATTLAVLSKSVNEQGNAAREQALQLLRAAIVDAQVKKCRAPKSETAAIYRQMVMDSQDRYRQLANQDYPAPSCADL